MLVVRGLVVSMDVCNSQCHTRSQHMNRSNAMQVVRSRVHALQQQQRYVTSNYVTDVLLC
jgi:protein subunit release factor A